MTKLYSYVVARDYGFAPNPFYGVCTLATCKPKIRSNAEIGDWIIGTGSKRQNKDGHAVFVMRVSEKLSFNEYWADPRFQRKRPNLRGSKKQAFGDNIYYKDLDGQWQQEDSHHSYYDGSCNMHNVTNDTKSDAVLVGFDFTYWGGTGTALPGIFRDYDGIDIQAKHGHKSLFPESMVDDFVEWFDRLQVRGCVGDPRDWHNTL